MKQVLLFILLVIAFAVGCSDLGSPPEIPVPELSVHGDTTSEGDIAECEVELSFEAPRQVTIIYTLEGVTATAGSDFVARTDTVVIAASDGAGHGEDHVHVPVELLQDDQIEPIEELTIRIISATNATVVEAEASCVILDDDGVPFVSVRDTNVAEGGVAQFKLFLSKPGVLPISFSYTVTDGSALATSDYVVAGGTDTIPAGETSILVPVTTVNDTLFELSESFSLTISAVANGTILDGTATATIPVNDPPSFATSIQPVLAARCGIVGCHGGSSAEGGLNLGAVTYHNVLHGSGNHGPILVVGNGAASSLYYKMTTSPQFESRMPPGGPYVPSSDMQRLKNWIDAGAPDN
jgi:hypothetical protein